MFLRNKYYRWYYQIVTKARKRVKPDKYFEEHHVIPRSLGGDNSEFNLVKLTLREHFLAHWLLTKFVKGTRAIKKMNCALAMMVNAAHVEIVPSRWYERASIAARLAKIGNKAWLGKSHSPETRAKMSRLMLGNKNGINNKGPVGYRHTAEARAKIGAASSARKRSAETKAKTGSAMLGRKPTEGTRKKLSVATSAWLAKSQFHLGRKRSDKTKKKISGTVTAWWARKRFVQFASTYGI